MQFHAIGALAVVLLASSAECWDDSFLPAAVRRMPADAGERFYPDYQAFVAAAPTFMPLAAREAAASVIIDRLYPEFVPSAAAEDTHDGKVWPRQPIFRRHESSTDSPLPWDKFRRAAEVLNLLQARSGCPSGFNSCSAIGYSDKCCVSTETCVEVDDQTTGNVACCPAGSTCSGSVASCPSSAVSCPLSLGGGCCLAGYVCSGTVCIKSGQDTTSESATSTSTDSSSTSQTPTTTSSQTTAAAPFRPVSTDEPTSDTTSEPTSTTEVLDNCPTGYYPCLARYGGGCCQTGRDCQETSCAPTSMTNIVTRSDLTIAIPVTDMPTATVDASDSCAQGWFLCDAMDNVAAGCCPDNYECGTASCTLSMADETTAVGKQGISSRAPAGPRAGLWSVGTWVCMAMGAGASLLLMV
ncbi:GPI anchored protein [Ceratocystis lukuohia]|uniref:GPI anchored protein n=1 Tax=Ceratocystis lukuohia TaxID=2019550 RepID=A0ABR4MAS6_9PEZI